MFDQALNAPIEFWLAAFVLTLLIVDGLQKWDLPWAKPALVVYGTVGLWYLGDYVLSTPSDYKIFEPATTQKGFYQVAAFLVVVRFGISAIVPSVRDTSSVNIAKVVIPDKVIRATFLTFTAMWFVLFMTAVVLQDGEWAALLWPPLRREKVGMFVHPGLGTGGAFLIAAAAYVHILTCASLGTFVVIGRGWVRWAAICMVAISYPYFFFDRVRNTMLALTLPATGAYWCFSTHRATMKIVISILLFFFIQSWFRQVAAYRGQGHDMRAFAASAKGVSSIEGLDMMKELCWINSLTESGRFKVNWGEHYYAQAVNFIPRTLWPNKPTINLDYTAARGFDNTSMGVATGLIGQGVLNFGPYLGIIAAAFMMTVWIAILARLWTQRASLPRLLLFALGMGLTFNMGREISLLILFPFVFGYVGIRIYEKVGPRRFRSAAAAPANSSNRYGRPVP